MQIKAMSCWGVGILFIVAGANHFASPDSYQAMMPPLLPWPLALIYISGAAEILGGAGVLLPRVRRIFGWGLIALLVAVFPANIFAAIHGFHGGSIERVILIARLPFQAVLMAWVYRSCVVGDLRKSPLQPTNSDSMEL
jgi:uncharacterized membrane protein